jgi:hypothetical protein
MTRDRTGKPKRYTNKDHRTKFTKEHRRGLSLSEQLKLEKEKLFNKSKENEEME